jgi:hypothetical protein
MNLCPRTEHIDKEYFIPLLSYTLTHKNILSKPKKTDEKLSTDW